MKGRQIILWRMATIAWAAGILWLSTEPYGGEETRSVLTNALAPLPWHIPTDWVGVLNAIWRKLAHFAEYAIFTFLLYRSFGGRERLRSQPQVIFWCLAGTALLAFTDEFHQAFVPGRTPSLVDCGIDVAGGGIAMSLVRHPRRFPSRRGE
jgi:VanZ family protein